MYISGHTNRVSLAPAQTLRHSQPVAAGLISEVVYRADQPMMAQPLLLPLLQQLGQQARWQLWLTPQKRLSRQWVQASGLPLAKVMQVSQMSAQTTPGSMIRALRTGNYSVVIGWVSEELTQEEYLCLVQAAEEGNSTGIIMRPVKTMIQPARQFTGLKIHSNLYH